MSMEIIRKSSETVDIRLSTNELNTLKNALNEVCNTLYISEFKTRMGVSCEEAMVFANSISRLLEKLSNDMANHNSDASS